MKRVVVTGLGAVAPNGLTLTESWDKTLRGLSGVDTLKSFDTSALDVRIAGEVTDFNASSFFSQKELKVFSRFVQFALVSGQEALKTSYLETENFLDKNIGCFIGVGVGDIGTIGETAQTLENKGLKRVSPYFIPYTISNMAAGHVAQAFRLRGPNLCLSTACASGTHAIGEAWLHIRNGLCEAALCGGSEAAISPVTVAGFSRMKALAKKFETPQTASRPFDRNRNGFVLSEGAGLLMLEEYEFAKKRGAPILAELVGYGLSCDAYHMTSPSPGGEGAVRCMKNALDSAELGVDQIEYINAHGSSTYYNDLHETEAIKTLFKDYAKELLVSSTKGATGHLLGGTGGLEACFLVKALEEGLIPPTANLEEAGEGLDLNYVPQKALERDFTFGLSNSFGFGGTNASLVFKKWDA